MNMAVNFGCCILLCLLLKVKLIIIN